jgi:hypothetical protein
VCHLLCADGEAAAGAEPESALTALLSELAGEAVPVEGEEALLERLGQLDLLLTWLWKVHGLDYYGGRELLLEADYMDRAAAARTLRGPRPEEGEEQDEDEGELGLGLGGGCTAGWGSRSAVTHHAHNGCGRWRCWVLAARGAHGTSSRGCLGSARMCVSAVRRCRPCVAADVSSPAASVPAICVWLTCACWRLLAALLLLLQPRLMPLSWLSAWTACGRHACRGQTRCWPAASVKRCAGRLQPGPSSLVLLTGHWRQLVEDKCAADMDTAP